MTLRQAITRCDVLQPNTFSLAQKVSWLSQLEGLIHSLLLSGREGKERGFPGFDDATDPDTLLAVEPPFDEVYIHFLHTRIHYHNGEIQRYNNANALFRAAWEEYANYVNRKAMVRPVSFRYF